jgi:arginyl-tRNA synthetase
VARLSSILAKARAGSRDDTGDGDGGENAERAQLAELAELADVDYALLADADEVLLAMLDFGPALHRAAAQNEPSVITGFAIQIAGAIHSYLRDHHVLRAEPALRRARLALVAASVRLLETALRLIGVATPKRM